MVLLGASNLSRSFDVAINMAREQLAGPLSFHVAKGHGRSYGLESSFFGKKISGIFSCGIWQSLEGKIDVPTTACLTDIGNDLAYEVPPETVIKWVATCVERLQKLDATIVLGDLPMEVLRAVGPRRYRLFRAAFFPRCRLPLRELIARAEQLSAGLHELGEAQNIPVFIGEKSWYRLDPIHPKRRYFGDWWRGFLSSCGWNVPAAPPARWPLPTRVFLKTLQPEHYSIFGRQRHARQPQGLLNDGTRVALY